MSKKIIILIFTLVLTITPILGYKAVSANTKIEEVENIIEYQEKKEKYLTHYNYTIENPNIILNPYSNSPLSAIIIFETPQEEETIITIQGKDQNSTYTNKFEKTKKHYIPIYGLYPNFDNKIFLKCGNQIKEYTIKTDPLPNDLLITPKENHTNNLYFITSDNYTYALDNNNEVRWYIKKKSTQKISQLENGHLLLSNDTLNNKNKATGLIEMDLLGKVYTEYNIGKSYYGSYAETPQTILVLSENLIELDKQSGIILREITLDTTYKTLSYNPNKQLITLENENNKLEINYQTNTKHQTTSTNLPNETETTLSPYNITQYKLVKGIKFTNNQKTKESTKNIILLNYKKPDKTYNNYNITIKKESERLSIKTSLTDQDEAYLILDKFLDKKIYELKDGYNYINKQGLNGKYSIYIKINNTIYKTNNYVTF